MTLIKKNAKKERNNLFMFGYSFRKRQKTDFIVFESDRKFNKNRPEVIYYLHSV